MNDMLETDLPAPAWLEPRVRRRGFPPVRLIAAAACLLFASTFIEVAAAEKKPAAAKQGEAEAAPQSLIGLTRNEVLTALGRPQATKQKGESETLIYGSGVRVELVGGRVVSYRGATEAVIVASDGTRYQPGDDGNVRRLATQPDAPAEVASEPERSPSAPTVVAPPAASARAAMPDTVDEFVAPPPDLPDVPGMAEAADPAAALKEATGIALPGTEEAEPEPAWMRVTETVLGMVFRLGFLVLILALSVKWMDLPYYLPDLIKVGLISVVIREGIYGLGGLTEGLLLLRFFRVHEIVTFFVMATMLFKFDVVRNGLTAMKVAAATYVVTYLLMIGIGIALTFLLLAIAGAAT